MARRVLGIVLVLCMMIGLLPGEVWAAGPVSEGDEAQTNARLMASAWFETDTSARRLQTAAMDPELSECIAAYFSAREDCFLDRVPDAVMGNGTVLSESVMAWQDAVDAFADRTNIRILDAVTTVSMDTAETVSGEDGSMIVYLREWTFFDYDDLADAQENSDLTGFGLVHKLTLVPDGEGWALASDEYNASAGFGICTMNDSTRQELLDMDYVPEDWAPMDQVTEIREPAEPNVNYCESYDPNAAADYADRYVYHEARGDGIFEDYYNSAYYNYNSAGGDCANYASQSIYAGGIPMTYGTHQGKDGWFYSNSSYRSGTWTFTPYLRDWMAEHWGKLVTASDNTVFKGSPVFYRDAHTAICVGYNSTGAPIIDAHNVDWYHARWDFWSDSGPITTVQLTKAPASVPSHAEVPENVEVSVSGQDVTVTFDAADNADYYDVYLVQEPWYWSDIKYSQRADGLRAVFRDVTPGVYRAFVIARPNPDLGYQSRWVQLEVTKPKPDTPVVTLSAESAFTGGDGITASWSAVPGVERYAYHLQKNGTSEGQRTDTVSALSVTFYNLTEGSYTLTVEAVDPKGVCSDLSEPVTFTIYEGSYSPGSTISVGDTQYLLYEAELPRDASEAYCASMGGHLAVIGSAQEDAAMTELLKNGTADWYWLGASKVGDTWMWDNGTPVPLTGAASNWGGLDGAASGDYLAKHRSTGAWAGIAADTASVGFLCQVDNASRFVTFDANGGSTAVSGKYVMFGDLYGTLPVPFRENYRFSGWYTELTGGTKLRETDMVTLRGDCTLYAHWTLTCTSGHAYQTEITMAPTTAFPGLLTSECTDCGSSVLTALPRLDTVNYDQELTRAATCSQEGIETYTWKTRTYGKLSFPVSIPQTPHSYKETVKEAGCMYRGTVANSCVICGDGFVVSRISALGHLWEGSGDQTFRCLRCGKQSACAPELLERPDQFRDVREKNWYYDAVLWAVWQDVTAGTSADTFAPNDACTRGQVVTFLWRWAGQPEPKMAVNPFSDISEDAYYYKAVMWAVEQGITTGTGKGAFSPNAPCTRAQVVTFLWRAADKPTDHLAYCPFTDVSEDAFFYHAVLWAVENRITSGMGNNTFVPSDPCTRAQVVTFLYNSEMN